MVGVREDQWGSKVSQLFLNTNNWLIYCSRAGVVPGSQEFSALLDVILKSPAVNLYGFYGHAGNSYASTSLSEASAFLSQEVEAVNSAAGFALEAISRLGKEVVVTRPFVLSVGSTPTAHAASAEAREFLSKVLHGSLELHAGKLSVFSATYFA